VVWGVLVSCHGHDDKARWISRKQESALVFVQY